MTREVTLMGVGIAAGEGRAEKSRSTSYQFSPPLIFQSQEQEEFFLQYQVEMI